MVRNSENPEKIAQKPLNDGHNVGPREKPMRSFCLGYLLGWFSGHGTPVFFFTVVTPSPLSQGPLFRGFRPENGASVRIFAAYPECTEVPKTFFGLLPRSLESLANNFSRGVETI